MDMSHAEFRVERSFKFMAWIPSVDEKAVSAEIEPAGKGKVRISFPDIDVVTDESTAVALYFALKAWVESCEITAKSDEDER